MNIKTLFPIPNIPTIRTAKIVTLKLIEKNYAVFLKNETTLLFAY